MDQAVIPAPVRFEPGAGPGFAFRPGTAVVYADTGITPIVERFCAQATSPGEVRVPAARILDAPRYAWRGLSLDVARTFFTVEEIRRVIDLLELYKLNVLHLHLTDDQAWRLAVGRPAARPEPGAAFYRDENRRPARNMIGSASLSRSLTGSSPST